MASLRKVSSENRIAVSRFTTSVEKIEKDNLRSYGLANVTSALLSTRNYNIDAISHWHMFLSIRSISSISLVYSM